MSHDPPDLTCKQSERRALFGGRLSTGILNGDVTELT
jgi:hypothetical protein